jgi:hypothetical protein
MISSRLETLKNRHQCATFIVSWLLASGQMEVGDFKVGRYLQVQCLHSFIAHWLG